MKQKLFVRSELETKFGSLSASESKKKLADYAMKHYDVKLSRQKSFVNMMNDLEEAVSATFEDARKMAGDAIEEINLEERVDFSDSVELDPDLMDKEEIFTEDDELIIDQVEHKPVVQDVGAISINDIPKEDKDKIVEGIKSGVIKIEAPLGVFSGEIIPEKITELVLTFPEGYQPKYKLVGPEGRAFVNVPYWIYDWMQGRNWRADITECPYDKDMLKSLAFYIERDGSVAIRESRNSKFIVIS
ncbi:inh [Aeromonas phage 31]|uniref:Inhibitor of prohead protease gp21 n=4 Tax=Biquartavirus TaxID=1912143 RepID=Q6U9C9_9CAUD|nr:minor head protein inhibitor of protease [Aeromonas phage 44RR2.8t]YP_238900.1 minor head protein inhibitor of protease [Aeromonas phage 31]APU00645.1 protein inh [Aeromonas phage 44RR2.8t.2]APU01065.1 protein inh [Aeromonas phage 31.2]APU01975.1 protein inh [Aeromonas phage L9-6]APU02227.1 protein inh [Aeromonas phage Riv-10]APU02473.1 protein inh [Aeromonas phage SW69-9]UYD59726.1 hypothetical protein JNMOADIG_00214 [Aeromonas phage avDM5]UYD60544.1 hypothetical protein NPHMPGLK_00209 